MAKTIRETAQDKEPKLACTVVLRYCMVKNEQSPYYNVVYCLGCSHCSLAGHSRTFEHAFQQKFSERTFNLNFFFRI